MPNAPLLRATMDKILANPDEHDQQYFAQKTECGTAYCFAGHALVESGYTFLFEPDAREGDVSWDLANNNREFPDNLMGIVDAAMKELDIDFSDALKLFSPENTQSDLKHMVDVLCSEGSLKSVPVTPLSDDD